MNSHCMHSPLLENQQNEPNAKQCSDDTEFAISVISSTARSLAGETVATITTGAKHMLHDWKVLLLGQLIALSLVTGFATVDELDKKCDFSAPAFQSLFLYIGLMAHFFVGNIKCCFCKQSSTQEDDDMEQVTESEGDSSPYTLPFISMPMQSKWCLFFFVSFIEVESQILDVLALKYTTVTSESVLFSIAIPSAVVCSRFILKWRYGLFHMIGVCICLSGAVVNFLADVDDGDDDGDNKLLGDFIMVISAILFGFLDALTELVCKEFSPAQYLYITGFFGTIISIVQISMVERDQIELFFGNNAECSMGRIYGLQTASTVSDFFSYTAMAYFLSISEATLLNLSILTINIYSVLFSVVFQQNYPHPLFFLASLLTITGTVVYESAPSPIGRMTP